MNGCGLTGMQIPLYAMKVAMKGLELEIKTGMKMNRGSMKDQFTNNLERLMGQKFVLPRSKAKALEAMKDVMGQIEAQLQQS